MRFVLALLASTALAPLAWAEQPPQRKPVAPTTPTDPHEPVPGAADPRVRTFAYNPGIVMRATSTGLTPLRFVFDPGETPVAIAGALVNRDPAKAKDWFATDVENTVVI